jgi:hypothetical protein
MDERLTPCECCEYPVTQRHHLATVSVYGESNDTTQLCATCHEAVHIFERAILDIRANKKKNTRAIDIMIELRDYWGAESLQLKRICDLVTASLDTPHMHRDPGDYLFKAVFGVSLDEL